MKNTFLYSMAALSLWISSCVSLDTTPLDGETNVTYWQNPSSAVETANACYVSLGNPDQIIYMDGASDNAHVRATSGKTQAIGNGSYNTADGFVASIWSYHYEGIKKCNLLTDNIDIVPELTDEMRNRYRAEALVIRALHYHELTVRFGDVPYFTHVISVDESKTIEKTSRETIVATILAELDDMLDNEYLPKSYPASETGRITHWAAAALKARILLNEGRYSEIKSVTGEIIEKSGHELHPDFAELFTVEHENNKEIIVAIQYALNLRENQGNYQFLPPSLAGVANISPSNELVESYIMLNGKGIHEQGSGYDEGAPWVDRDPRLAMTICYDGGYYTKADGSKQIITINPESSSNDRFQPGTSVITTSTGYYFKKFYDNKATTAQKSGLNYPVIRYADVLLMHAEACAETHTLTAEEWNKTIRPLRVRAGFTDSKALDFPDDKSQQELIEIVRNERRCELAFEGLRMKDIYRWRTAETVMNGKLHGMKINETIGTDKGYYIVETRSFDKDKHYLWPIPQSERDINQNLEQNPNW